MGAVLVRSAFSANIKERRDCSTALFDEHGRMIVAGRAHPRPPRRHARGGRRRAGPRPAAGRALRPQRPVHGRHAPSGHHASSRASPCGFAVSRAHHADVGGMEPASLPAESRELYQEGVIIPPVRLDDEVLTLLLANMRNPDERRGDLRAQIAAHRLAERRLEELVGRRGRGDASRPRWTSSTATRSGSSARRSPSSRTAATRRPTSSSRSRARWRSARRCTIAGDEVEIDFAGTSPQHDGNLNCPRRGHALGLLLRRPLPDLAGPAVLGRRLRAGHDPRARGLARQRPSARRGRGR